MPKEAKINMMLKSFGKRNLKKKKRNLKRKRKRKARDKNRILKIQIMIDEGNQKRKRRRREYNSLIANNLRLIHKMKKRGTRKTRR